MTKKHLKKYSSIPSQQGNDKEMCFAISFFYLSESVKQVTAHDVISLWLAGAINILIYNFLVNAIINIASIVYKLLFLWSLVSCCETSLVCFYQCGFITFVLGSCLSNHTGKKMEL